MSLMMDVSSLEVVGDWLEKEGVVESEHGEQDEDGGEWSGVWGVVGCEGEGVTEGGEKVEHGGQGGDG